MASRATYVGVKYPNSEYFTIYHMIIFTRSKYHAILVVFFLFRRLLRFAFLDGRGLWGIFHANHIILILSYRLICGCCHRANFIFLQLEWLHGFGFSLLFWYYFVCINFEYDLNTECWYLCDAKIVQKVLCNFFKAVQALVLELGVPGFFFHLSYPLFYFYRLKCISCLLIHFQCILDINIFVVIWDGCLVNEYIIEKGFSNQLLRLELGLVIIHFFTKITLARLICWNHIHYDLPTVIIFPNYR